MQKKINIFFIAAVLFVFSCTHQSSVPESIAISSMVNLTSTCVGCPSSPVCPIIDDIPVNTSTTYHVCSALPSGQGVYELNDNNCLVWTPSGNQTEIVTTCIVVCTGKVCDTTLITIFPPVPSDTVQAGIKCSQDTVYFENDILPIISASCAYTGCHNETTAADGVRLYNYSNIINTGKVKAFKTSDSKLYEVITESKAKDVMPPPPAAKLTTLQINMIGKWIAQGAKNNKCNENPGSCNTENVSFTTYIKPALASCTSCHKTGNTRGGINLDSYQGFKIAAESGRLLGAIKWSPGYMAMPQGSLKLPECTINKVKSWIDAGAPNN